MPESNQTPAVPVSKGNEKKVKIFYEHGRDALGLAVAVANNQEEKALRKAERHHHQPQPKDRDQMASHGRKRLDEAKRLIAKRRAEVKRDKARARKESKSQPQQRDDAKMTAPEAPTSAAPRKRVTFA